MAVKHSSQDWTIGAIVKVGFMRLMVTGFEPTPGDYRPDRYHLMNPSNGKCYTFTPHYGLEIE